MCRRRATTDHVPPAREVCRFGRGLSIDKDQLTSNLQCVDVADVDPIGFTKTRAMMENERTSFTNRLAMDANFSVVYKRLSTR